MHGLAGDRPLERTGGPVTLPNKLRVEAPASWALDMNPLDGLLLARFIRVGPSNKPKAELRLQDGPRLKLRFREEVSMQWPTEDWFLGKRVMWSRGTLDGQRLQTTELDLSARRWITVLALADDDADLAELSAIAHGLTVEQ